MLEFIGTIAGNILSLPGILGFSLGLLTRRPALAAVFGGLVGLLEAMIFSGFSLAAAGGLELAVSVAVGVVAGVLGCLVRRKGAMV